MTKKPGEKSPGGNFDQLNTKGRKVGESARVPRDKTMPPTNKKGYKWNKKK